jgi:hypothetical protein
MTLEEITHRLGKTPSSGWSRGDRILRSNIGIERVMGFTSWYLDAPLEDDAPVHSQVDALYQPVRDISSALRGNAEMKSTLQIVQYFSIRSVAGFNLSAEWISLLGAIGAVVDVDQYE